MSGAEHSAAAKAKWTRLFEFKYWNYWATEPFGLSLQYSLGKDFIEFLRYPLIGGQPTFLVGVLHIAVVAIAIFVLGRYLTRCFRNQQVIIDRSPTGFTVGAVLFGYGTLLTISCLPVYRHYLIITFPLMFVWLAQVVLQSMSANIGRRLLLSLCVIQFCISFLFLNYIHQVDRPIRGDYGMPYRLR
jgi:hypothetical protein